ncbi:MAG TPA: DUF1146 domain-containing protein [Acholeplasma sp.]|jgi:uncharacterized membrane protein YwzB|nr:DUF1146 family protein [Acholeplasmatales bacterium]HHV33754.1 DUF1146 domain-containing protein [Acholeplasma sp.]
MNDYFYFGGLLIGFIWTFKTLQSTEIEKIFKKGHVWQIRSAYTLLALLGGHVFGSVFERIYLLILRAFEL